ncbi:MAG: DUF5522 domain-containing protein [Planctomycetota bacterium]
MSKPSLQEGRDYVIDERGNLVFTALYLLERGRCCGSGCENCPFDYERVPEPQRSVLRAQRESKAHGFSRGSE